MINSQRQSGPSAPRRRRGRVIAHIAALALVVTGLAACSQPPVPRDQFYRLGATMPSRALEPAPLDGALTVERLRGEGLISQRPILFATREQPNRIEQHNYQYWFESPPLMLRDALIDYLRAAHAASVVVSDQDRRDSGCELTGALRRLEHVTAGGEPSVAVIEIELMLRRINGNSVLLHRTYRAEQTALDLTMDATVNAFDQALGALFARFVAELSTTPTDCPVRQR